MRNLLRLGAGIAIITAALVGQNAHAQVLFTGTNYTQNFDSLANTGTANAFTDNTTLLGWYAVNIPGTGAVTLADDYRADVGTSNTGDLYSYGAAGSTDRALGSLASGTTGTLRYGLQLRNNSAQTINSFTLSYTGEEWRDGVGANANALTFAYDVRAASTGDSNLSSGTFTTLSALTFTAPVNGAADTALDGNAAANSVSISNGVISGLNWQPGQDLWLRWEDLNDAGNDDGLALDNLTFSASVGTTPVVPEAGTLALVGTGMLPLAAVVIRRRRKAA